MSKELRGYGRVYLRGKTFWIQYSARGELHRESSRSTERKAAVKLLKFRVGEAISGKVGGNVADKVTLSDMIAALRDDYSARRNRSTRLIDRVEHHLVAHFGENARAVSLTCGKLQDYVEARKTQLVKKNSGVMVAPSDSTVNMELRLLRRAFNLMAQKRRLSRDDVPTMPMLAESPARQGFVDPPELARLLEALPVELRDAVAFLYHAAGDSTRCERLSGGTSILPTGRFDCAPSAQKIGMRAR